MATELKRFTISVSDEMKMDLDEEKKETYYAETKSEMIRDLIARGFAVLREGKATTEKAGEKSASDTKLK